MKHVPLQTIGFRSVFHQIETPSPTMSFSRGDLIRSRRSVYEEIGTAGGGSMNMEGVY